MTASSASAGPYSADFWSGRRVLLTGHTGFKGAWLALWLQSMGAQLTGLALDQPVPGAIFHRAGVAQGMRSVIGDIRDAALVRRVVEEARPEFVFHLAAQALVGTAFRDPLDTYMTNVMGTGHVLDALRFVEGVRVATVVTTDKCYDNQEWEWPYRETDILGGKDPYGNSKACAELVADCWRRSYLAERGVSVATARAGNVIGGGDWAEHRIIPDCIREFSVGQPVTLRRPNATRPWQHVMEPLAGYLELAWRQFHDPVGFAQALNFGPRQDAQMRVEDVVSRMTARWPGASYRIDPATASFPEAGLLALDISRALARLDWQPRLGIDAAVDRTVDWYRAAMDAGTDMRVFTLAQIQAYLNTSSVSA